MPEAACIALIEVTEAIFSRWRRVFASRHRECRVTQSSLSISICTSLPAMRTG
jgi:hypothetical protein